LFLALPNDKYHGLFIEMKIGKIGDVYKRQQLEIHQLLSSKNYQVVICRSVEEFEKIINDYIKII